MTKQTSFFKSPKTHLSCWLVLHPVCKGVHDSFNIQRCFCLLDRTTNSHGLRTCIHNSVKALAMEMGTGSWAYNQPGGRIYKSRAILGSEFRQGNSLSCTRTSPTPTSQPLQNVVLILANYSAMIDNKSVTCRSLILNLHLNGEMDHGEKI